MSALLLDHRARYSATGARVRAFGSAALAFLGAACWGAAVLPLALRPIDSTRILLACRLLFTIYVLVALVALIFAGAAFGGAPFLTGAASTRAFETSTLLSETPRLLVVRPAPQRHASHLVLPPPAHC